MTPLQIETFARRLMNAESSQFWSQAEIIENYLYTCALELATETLCIQNRYTTPSVASQQEYTVPSRMISVLRVDYNGEKLKPISFKQLDSIDLNTNTTTTGTPQYYYHFDDVFGLFPVPDTAALTITIHSYDEPSQTTAVSTLEIPTRYHNYLAQGVAYLMSLKELGHPNTAHFERKWAQAIFKVKRTERGLKNRDTFNRVIREEDLPQTYLGAN